MHYSGIILAGGKSRRMGRDKALLSYGNTSFLQRAVDLLIPFCNEIFISISDKTYLPENSRIHTIKDLFPEAGPLGGIYSALQQIHSEKAIVIPVDMPLLNREVLEKLLAEDQSDKDIVLFTVGKRLQPFPGLYARALSDSIGSQIRKGNLKMYDLIARSRTKVISGNRFFPYFANINTPDDEKNLHRQ